MIDITLVGIYNAFSKGGLQMFEKVQDVIAEELDVAKEDITMDASILNDLGADSLDVVELIMSLEEAFDIEVSDEKAQSLKTVRDVIEYIESVQ